MQGFTFHLHRNQKNTVITKCVFFLTPGLHISVTDTPALNMVLEAVQRTPKRHTYVMTDENLKINLSCVPNQQRV